MSIITETVLRGGIQLPSISVILYSTDSSKQLPCNEMLMTQTIVIGYNMVKNLPSIAF